MHPDQEPSPAVPPGKPKASPAEIERRRKEQERQNARRSHKPNLKTIPWKK